MKFRSIFLFFIFFSITSFAQYSVRAGMGISFNNAPSLIDYINQNFASAGQQLNTFGTAINFNGEFDYSINNTYQIGIDINYFLNSYSFTSTSGIYKMDYNILMPSLVNYYVISGLGYNFKFGGGIGPRFVTVSEQIPGTPSAINYTSTGFGFLARFDGNTLLSKDLYANIGFDLRYDINSKPQNGNNYMVNSVTGAKVDFNMFSTVIRLGITYNF